MQIRRLLFAATLAAAGLSSAAVKAQVQDWPPSAAVRVIVPFAAGGPVDVPARLINERLAAQTKGTFILENRSGAGGTIGAQQVAQAAPDGQTLLFTTSSLAIAPTLYANLPFDPLQFTAISLLAEVPIVLTVRGNSPIRTLAEYITKAKAEPGKITFGSPGHGTINQIAVEWLALEAGIKLLHVPYRGGAAMANSLAAGDIALGVTTQSSVQGLIDAGKIKVLAILGADRPSFLRDAPTMTDSGLKVDAGLNLGIYVPAGTPAAIVERIDTEVLKILKDEALRKRFNELGMDVTPISRAALAERIRSEAARYKMIIEQTGVKLE
jgi:tripartite-type tricarboxylate transporter receptor subunit TctC